MLKVSKLLQPTAAQDFEFTSYDDFWLFNVLDSEFTGGYYAPESRSGHPDDWHDNESEDPEISSFTIDFWDVTPPNPEEDAPLAPTTEPTARLTYAKGKFTSTAPVAQGVEQFIYDDIIPKLIEAWWGEERSGNHYDGPDDYDVTEADYDYDRY